MTDPKVYLAVDNCFASKRWTRPAEWMELIGKMGVTCVEASADNECDPLYMDREYMERWVQEVEIVSRKTGVRISNLYSGHGTYATLGLAHHDAAIRDRIQHDWLKPMADIAASVNAGLGFYCHAFPDSVLQDPVSYRKAEEDLYDRLADIAGYARNLGIRAPGVEQMYTPHQIPWTIAGSKRLLKEVFQRSRSPFYLTLDTGHQSGQWKFVRPDAGRIEEMGVRFRQDGHQPGFWLGPRSAYELFELMIQEPAEQQTGYIEQIGREMDRFPHLFAMPTDADTYRWLEEFGGYSPIIHLQQTTGKASAHQPFTEECNRGGNIFGEPLLKALAIAYQNPDDEEFPPKCEEIYLTLEIFSGTSELNTDIVKKMQDSVSYWRKFIPEDGLKLSQLISLIR
ncbi:MAG: hypothetical protein JWR03_1063 [Cohnella sp.]|nr:hypothetical protein [Cohnella sp.]